MDLEAYAFALPEGQKVFEKIFQRAEKMDPESPEGIAFKKVLKYHLDGVQPGTIIDHRRFLRTLNFLPGKKPAQVLRVYHRFGLAWL